MRNAETVLGVIREREFEAETTGELLEIERLTSSSEGGRWKSATGNSLAAYPTCAAERGVESLTQSGGARRDAPGSSD
jgi:hypothetical protein